MLCVYMHADSFDDLQWLLPILIFVGLILREIREIRENKNPVEKRALQYCSLRNIQHLLYPLYTSFTELINISED